MAKRTTRDGIEIIRRRFGVDPRTDANVQSFAEDYRAAQMIYNARTAAGMSQEQLAQAIGEDEDTIARLESADYEGHSIGILRRVAAALHMKLRIELVAIESV